jgi:hypothetical protein
MKYYTKVVPSDMAILYETYTTKDILNEYFLDWTVMMARTNQLITEEACIADWVLVNQAWESDSEGYHVLSSSASGVSEWC